MADATYIADESWVAHELNKLKAKMPLDEAITALIKLMNALQYEEEAKEIDALKANWLSDPHWPIEDTHGFEGHHDELLSYRLIVEEEQERTRRAQLIVDTGRYGLTEAGIERMRALEYRVKQLEEKLERLLNNG